MMSRLLLTPRSVRNEQGLFQTAALHQRAPSLPDSPSSLDNQNNYEISFVAWKQQHGRSYDSVQVLPLE